ncbi:sensor histidine kinase [Phytoactinopolyspora limicola]|uniref:sensor histidine kinase n=1 Tax=Phytoactinopolyspora limicola TaxID=2715536 RepID=UPI0014084A91|nr:sensor histidine kinase [Phytoactinopolyspora limicola]
MIHGSYRHAVSHRVLRGAGCSVLVAALCGWGVAVPWARPLATTTAAAAVVMFWWPLSKTWLPWLVGGAGAVSGAATVGHRLLDWPGMPPLAVVETVLLWVLVGMVVRWAPVRSAAIAGASAGLAAAVGVLRIIGPADSDQLSPEESLYAVAFWALGPIVAAAISVYLRHLDDRRTSAVAAARQAQRLDLAHDLHDYVAHDVSEMIAQAQAAQVIIDDTHPAHPVLRRIEAAGLRAMTSMDRTVHLLRGGAENPERSDAENRSLPGMAELPELAERFGSTSSAVVHLSVDPVLALRVPRELAGTVYRVVVEALTNIRRHAPSSDTVEIAVHHDAHELEVVVRNEGAGAPAVEPGRSGGLGLPGLSERVEAMGGTFHAGPIAGGWAVRARFPLVASAPTYKEAPR